MTDIAISVENLSKSYLVGHNAAQSERYTALRDVLSRNARSLTRRTRDMFSGRAIVQGDEVEEFWALKDVSFEITRGDRVGIIGRNGAGKSTLLKILSRITEPTSGRIKIAGRVASLLEVGTGFHPELTGRENIFLNGAILGMKRGEILRKFDEIVDFAEVEKFLDTPVKRYSSGMYVRLAFAVAAHLEPEVLIVDEVLAVGDAQFQKKCLGKMKDAGKQGRTVLFVSHSMDAINNLCSTAIMLENGSIIKSGPSFDVTKIYLEGARQISGDLIWIRPENFRSNFDDVVQVIDYSVRSEQGISKSPLFKSSRYWLEINAKIKIRNGNIVFFASFYSDAGKLLFVSDCFDNPIDFDDLGVGYIRMNLPIPVELFNTGSFYVEASCVIHHTGWPLPPGNGQMLAFEFIDDSSVTKMQFTANHPLTGSIKPGFFSVKLPWTLSNISISG